MSLLSPNTIVAIAPNKEETKNESFWLAWILQQCKDDPTFWYLQWFQRLQTKTKSLTSLSQGINVVYFTYERQLFTKKKFCSYNNEDLDISRHVFCI